MERLRTFGARLKHARERQKMTLAGLAKALTKEASEREDGEQITAQAISKWENEISHPDPRRFPEIKRVLDVSLDWLIAGVGLPGDRESSSLNLTPVTNLKGRVVPRLSVDDAIAGRRNESANGRAANYVHSHFPCSASSYALTIDDKANWPAFKPGDSVIIDPEAAPRPGDMVFAAYGKKREPRFRKLRLQAQTGKLGPVKVLVPLNSAEWPEEMMSGPDDGEILGVMVEHTSPRSS